MHMDGEIIHDYLDRVASPAAEAPRCLRACDSGQLASRSRAAASTTCQTDGDGTSSPGFAAGTRPMVPPPPHVAGGTSPPIGTRLAGGLSPGAQGLVRPVPLAPVATAPAAPSVGTSPPVAIPMPVHTRADGRADLGRLGTPPVSTWPEDQGARGGALGDQPLHLASPNLAHTPPQALHVRVSTPDTAPSLPEGRINSVFRPVACAASPPLFGASPPALSGLGGGPAPGGPPPLLPSAFCASAAHGPRVSSSPRSSSPHEGSASSKASSRRNSPFLDYPAVHRPSATAAPAGMAPPVGTTLPPGLQGVAIVPANLGSSTSAFAAAEVDGGGELIEGAEDAPPLHSTRMAASGLGRARGLSRTIGSLSRDLDALRTSINMGHAAGEPAAGAELDAIFGMGHADIPEHSDMAAAGVGRDFGDGVVEEPLVATALAPSAADVHGQDLIFPFAPTLTDPQED